MLHTLFLSLIWSSASGILRFLKHRNLLNLKKLDSRVISVGNLQVGGSGKTPLVACIAREAAERGLKVCILCRGYRSQWEKSGGVLFPKEPAVHSQLCGDEAALLHDLCPDAYIGVGADRFLQFQKVLEKAKVRIDLVILDDGFQNWRLHKDLEIIALTAKRPWEVLFRDFKGALRDADLCVWTKGSSLPAGYFIHFEKMNKPWVKVNYVLSQSSSSRELQKESLWLITGIADGASALSLALQSGYSIVNHIVFQDHAHYSKEKMTQLLNDAAQSQCTIVLTGKDWVKWRDFGVSKDKVIVLEPELIFEKGRHHWLRLLWAE